METMILSYDLKGKRIEVVKKNGAYYVKDEIDNIPCLNQSAAIVLFYNKIETNHNGGKNES